jgi:hypothetical protein
LEAAQCAICAEAQYASATLVDQKTGSRMMRNWHERNWSPSGSYAFPYECDRRNMNDDRAALLQAIQAASVRSIRRHKLSIANKAILRKSGYAPIKESD